MGTWYTSFKGLGMRIWWEICNMKWGFAKKVITESQRQFMYGSNFYESDFRRVSTSDVYSIGKLNN